MISWIFSWAGYRRSGSLLLALACLVVGQAGQVLPQAKDPPETPSGQKGAGSKKGKGDRDATPVPAATEKRELHIYEPRYAKANELATLLSNLYRITKKGDEPTPQLTVDETTNRLLFSAGASSWREVGELLSKIDIPTSAGGGERSLTFIPLGKGLHEDFVSLQNVLNMLFANNPKVKYSLVPSKNLLVLDADERTQTEVQKLCIALAEAREPARTQAQVALATPTMQIRLMWLVDSEDKQDGAALTGEVLKIVPVLAKLGVEHPRVLSNSMVTSNANGGNVFKSFGNAIFRGEAEAFVHLSGNCRPIDENHVHLNVDLRVNSDENAKGQTIRALAGITTEIQAPLGHYVVLGMAPSNGKTSVFVVQVTQVE